ncbi:bestrophin-like domain [Cellulosimicrobium sp. Marseille-Q8652]
MSILVGAVVTAVVTALAVVAMLFARRRAPAGSRFADGDRAAGVFGVVATGFSVLLGFIVFLAFESYDEARTGAQAEARIVVQQLETAQFLADPDAAELSGELVCYARSVVSLEWEQMADGELGDAVNPWGVELFETIRGVVPASDTEQSAYDRWLAQEADREEARQSRVHGAEGLIPLPLWLVLYAVSATIFVLLLFFADSAEGAATQGVLMGSVVLVITLLLCLLAFFDRPHGHEVGKLRPTAMERTLVLLELESDAAGVVVDAPCDEQGRPLAAAGGS